MTALPAQESPVIIEAALNGQTLKTVNPRVPRSSEELVADGLACMEAGAAILHTHIDDILVSGEQATASYLEHFAPILASRPDAILYPTLGFGGDIAAKLDHEARLAKECDLRMGIVDPGSVNLGGAEANGLPQPIEFVYSNTPGEIRYAFDLCARLELGPSIAIFEPGFLRHTLAYHRAGRLGRGAMVKFYMGGDYGYMGSGHRGVNFGLPAEPWALDVYLRMLGDCDVPWSIGVLGGDVFDRGLAAHALERGGHLRVGLEDHMGNDTPSNLELVERAAALCRNAGRPVATPTEASEILGLRPARESRA